MEQMTRLSIELPKSQHQKIKALAVGHGLSLKDYIIQKTVCDEGYEDVALHDLMGILMPRIEEARKGKRSRRTMAEIAAKAKSRRRGS